MVGGWSDILWILVVWGYFTECRGQCGGCYSTTRDEEPFCFTTQSRTATQSYTDCTTRPCRTSYRLKTIYYRDSPYCCTSRGYVQGHSACYKVAALCGGCQSDYGNQQPACSEIISSQVTYKDTTSCGFYGWYRCPRLRTRASYSRRYRCCGGYQLIGTTCRKTSTTSNVCEVNNGGCSQLCNPNNPSDPCSCRSGYTRGSDRKACQDVNECSLGTHTCTQEERCVNSQGSFLCFPRCPTGYQLGPNSNCVDIDECASGVSQCATGSLCQNNPGSYSCPCADGFITNGGVGCADVDECASGSANCGLNTRCVNSVGSYYCLCQPGYSTSDGGVCADVDECTRTPCPAGYQCTNNPGSYSCSMARVNPSDCGGCVNTVASQQDACRSVRNITKMQTETVSCGPFGWTRCTRPAVPHVEQVTVYNCCQNYQLVGHICVKSTGVTTTPAPPRGETCGAITCDSQQKCITRQSQNICTCTPATETCRDPCCCGVSRYADRGLTVTIRTYAVPLVIGGKPARTNEFPWQASIRRRTTSGGLLLDRHVCGAVIIGPGTILTAAHCVNVHATPVDRTNYRIYVGDHRLSQVDSTETVHEIRQIVNHPEYDYWTLYADIAVIYLSKPITYSAARRPACLPTPGVDLSNKLAIVAGWGYVNNIQSTPDELQYTTLYVRPVTVCRQAGFREELLRDILCVSDNNGDTDQSACNGDSGGALVTQSSSGQWAVSGLVSFKASNRCGDGKPQGYTNVNHHRTWLDSVL